VRPPAASSAIGTRGLEAERAAAANPAATPSAAKASAAMHTHPEASALPPARLALQRASVAFEVRDGALWVAPTDVARAIEAVSARAETNAVADARGDEAFFSSAESLRARRTANPATTPSAANASAAMHTHPDASARCGSRTSAAADWPVIGSMRRIESPPSPVVAKTAIDPAH
ncbi:MAG: hypothetical protein ACKOHI_00910, partial [Phycisphaerales bacterium]